jgi:hypothetical protein
MAPNWLPFVSFSFSKIVSIESTPTPATASLPTFPCTVPAYKRHPVHHSSPLHSSWPPTRLHFASSTLSVEGFTAATSSVRTANTPSPSSCHRDEFWSPTVLCGKPSGELQQPPMAVVHHEPWIAVQALVHSPVDSAHRFVLCKIIQYSSKS